MKFKRKHIFTILGVVLLLIQFVRIDKTNPPIDLDSDFIVSVNTPTNIALNIKEACYDCHSHATKYPWYTSVAPVSWWVKGHINGGREHLNFSAWNTYSQDKKDHKIEECIEVMEKGWMPLASYTWMHPEAKLTDLEHEEMISYFKSLR